MKACTNLRHSSFPITVQHPLLAGHFTVIGSGFLCLEVMSIQFHAKRMLEAGPSGGADYFIRFLTLKLTSESIPG